MFKKHQILYVHFGENSDTAKSPYAVWTGQVDLEEEKQCCLNWDDNRLVGVKKYDVREVVLPDWLNPEAWINNTTCWEWAWKVYDMKPEWPEQWQRSIVNAEWGESQTYALCKLLGTQSFRSTFRQSLYNQVVEWLNTEPDERKFSSPLSPKQWDKLDNAWSAREASRRSNSRYYSSRYTAYCGLSKDLLEVQHA